MADKNWFCIECNKKKEDYEAMYCDKCWQKEQKEVYLAIKLGICTFCGLQEKGGNINERCHCD